MLGRPIPLPQPTLDQHHSHMASRIVPIQHLLQNIYLPPQGTRYLPQNIHLLLQDIHRLLQDIHLLPQHIIHPLLQDIRHLLPRQITTKLRQTTRMLTMLEHRSDQMITV